MALTTRQWLLYNYLKDNYTDNEYISKSQIVSALPEYYEIKEGETRVCRDIEFDVRDINADETIQKVIVSSRKGYKIGNPEQVNNYVVSNIISAKKELKHYYKLKHKAELNGQYRIQFGCERDIIEAYLDK